MFPSNPHRIIAIGASAGGMDEINSFFDHTPLDGVCYIIIQHLSSDFKSRMVELLARHSKLSVKEAEENAVVKSNEVYMIPHDKYMEIRNNTLHLYNKEKTQATHLTINRFFNSLAVNSGANAIAIVLSGLGSDGTEGIKAVKKAGGMVIVRNPETSAFASMPSNAIGTGLVDFILEPELMPGAIEDYIKYGSELETDDQDDEKNLAKIINLIKEKSPLDFSDYKPTTILRRTKRRAANSNFTSLENYFEFLKSRPDEIDTLAKEYLISVTSFFRDKEAFQFIQKEIFPAIIEKIALGEELKMWVAGCATGEEVYSLAILVHELLTGPYKDIVVKIFATDIDSSALIHAGKGIYSSSIAKDVSAERLENHFLKEGNNYRIKPAIRKMVIFAQHDLVKNPPYCNMHFISCRNLLIYMTPILQKKIFTMLLFGLKMDGYLFLGSSESPMPIIRNLEIVNKKWKIYKNLETKRVTGFDAFSIPDYTAAKQPVSAFLNDEALKKSTANLANAVNENLVNEQNLLIVCIDDKNTVLQTYGDTTKYLLQKNFNSNLPDLLQKPLAIALNTLSMAVWKTNKKHTVKGVAIKTGKLLSKVNMSVSPLEIRKGGKKLLMVTFSEGTLSLPAEDMVFDETIFLDQYTLNLEEELKELKEKLNSAYEQLDASNENMQSFNEELLSSNEELQSTNEEMQSVNEELDTINSNYQLKNKELLEINDDLNNYFRSNVNGQLFIDNDLRVMRFSPGAVKQINLLDTDIGRPLSNISTNIKFETIIEDIKTIIADGGIITKEIQTNDGKWYQMMTMPYIQQADNKKNGAIVTFNDITELKAIQLQLDRKNKSLLRINADHDNFVHTASHDLLAPLGNIELSIGVLNNKITDPGLVQFLTVLNSSVKKFRSLITDISIIAKIESEMISLELIDIDELLTNILWSLEDKVSLSNAKIMKQLEVKHVLFSKNNLRSILYNLISNAIKFNDSKIPEITIKTYKENETVVLSVQDNGIGMEQADLNKIFDMYGRLHHQIEGHGIGLYLAKKIIDAAEGNIVVESKPGEGSKFTIHFQA